jgi:hypothetical protein
MASLLESLGQSLTPETIGTLGKAFGLDEKMVQQGMSVVGPLVQGSLANSASTPSGLDGLMKILTPQQGASTSAGSTGGGDWGSLLDSLSGGSGGGSTDMLGGLMGALSGEGAGSDLIGGLVNGLFGDGLSAIGATLDKSLGFKVSPLIAAAAPMLLSQLRKVTQEQNLDAAGVANLLQQEQRAFQEQGGETAALVTRAMQAGDDAIALKGKFAPEEWMKVRLGPMAAAAAVMGASPSGPMGLAQEMTAGLQTLSESQGQAEPTSLLNVAFASPFSEDEKNMFSVDTPKSQLLASLQEAVGLVASKDPAGLAAYRQLVVAVSTKVAEASKEGGFLGFGGKQVSDAEKAALSEIQQAIGA